MDYTMPKLVALAKVQTAAINAALDDLLANPYSEDAAKAIESAGRQLGFIMDEVFMIQFPDLSDPDDEEA